MNEATSRREGPGQEARRILFDNAADLQFEVARYTVAIHFFRGKPKRANYQTSGSGVLVVLNQRCFLLTAGHCVLLASNEPVAVTIDNRPHEFVPQFARSGFVYEKDTERDFGFWELAASDKGTIEARQKLFLPLSRIEVLNSDQCDDLGDLVVLGGYPIAFHIVVDAPVKKVRTGLLTYSAELAGTGEAPQSTIGRHYLDYQVADIWVPEKRLFGSFPNPRPRAELPSLRGASGGGCWNAGVGYDLSHWSASRLRLIGIHVGTGPSCIINDEPHAFFRQVLLGHHLRLIAESDPTMRPYIEAKWPNIADFPI